MFWFVDKVRSKKSLDCKNIRKGKCELIIGDSSFVIETELASTIQQPSNSSVKIFQNSTWSIILIDLIWSVQFVRWFIFSFSSTFRFQSELLKTKGIVHPINFRPIEGSFEKQRKTSRFLSFSSRRFARRADSLGNIVANNNRYFIDQRRSRWNVDREKVIRTNSSDRL